MKRIICATALLLAGLCVTRAAGQVFYQYPDAKVLATGQSAVAPYLAIGDDELVRFAGAGRVGFATYLDVGLEVMLEYVSGDWWGGIGGDAKFQMFPDSPTLPFDLSLEAGLGYREGNSIQQIHVPLGAVVSSPFSNDSGTILTPYMGVYLLIIETEYSTVSDTDLEVELRGGVRYVRPSGLDLFATFQVGYEALFAVGTVFSFGKKSEG